MVIKKFYLESTKPLQEVGMRAQVISYLIAQGVKEGNAINDSDNKKKVIVAVQADTEGRIKDIRDELVRYLNKLHENDFCYSKFPNDIQASELMELSNPHYVTILPLNELANSLMLEQTSKGVGAMLYLADNLKPLKDLPSAIKKLTAQLAK